MTVTLIHSQVLAGGAGTATLTPSTAPTPGNLMVLACATRDVGLFSPAITGWTLVTPASHPSGIVVTLPHTPREFSMFYRVVQSGDTTWTVPTAHTVFMYAEFHDSAGSTWPVDAMVGRASPGTTLALACGGAITTSGPAFIFGAMAGSFTNDGETMSAAPISPSVEVFDKGGTNGAPGWWGAYREESTGGTYTVAGTATLGSGPSVGIGEAGITIAFITGPPDLPHEPDPVEPDPPAGVLLEIYAAEVGAARWDVAHWDEAVWSTAGWQDVTPQGVRVKIGWGSSRPELGILSTPDPASWAVDFFDPDRLLDPANEDGPYFGDLEPFLPIRVSHRGTIVRVGYATAIGHSFARSTRNGYIRATDNISRLANAAVPPDTELADTLYARARDAIAAAGLSVTVAAPIGADPAVSAWSDGLHEWSAWQWIADAAQEVLRIPIVDRLGTLTFRPWASPLVRARGLTNTELVDLQSIVDYAGLFSVVRARSGPSTVIERRLTPPPRYGTRTYTRDEVTTGAAAWAEAVLADRTFAALRWIPGDVRPLTAVRTEIMATVEAVERLTLSVTNEDPPISTAGVVVGGEITIDPKIDDEAIWSFRYHMAQASIEPLIETGGDPTDYLLATGGGEFVFPTSGG